MAQLFVQSAGGEWCVAPLHRDADNLRTQAFASSEVDASAIGALLRAADGAWVLIASDHARLNGVPLPVGLRVLRDRDEISVGPHRAFFSAEEPPRVEPFPGADHPVDCPRCKQPLAAGDPAVRCSCLIWYHQSSDLPCFAYAARCALCDRPTALDAGHLWSPEAL